MTAFIDFMKSQDDMTFWLLCGFFLVVAVLVVPRLLAIALALAVIVIGGAVAGFALIFAGAFGWYCHRQERKHFRANGIGTAEPIMREPNFVALAVVAVMIAGMAGFVVIERSRTAPDAAQAETLNETWK